MHKVSFIRSPLVTRGTVLLPCSLGSAKVLRVFHFCRKLDAANENRSDY